MKTFTKSISWAVTSGVVIFCTTYASTGNATASLASAAVASLIKTPVYSVHETAFNALWAKWTAARPVAAAVEA